MAIVRSIPPLPTDAPVVDRNGNITQEWQRFFVNLLAVLNEIRTAIP